MNILITGARGFIGRNLVENLKTIRDGKNRTRPGLVIHEIYEYDADTELELLDQYCAECSFVFHLAGVNRPVHVSDFMSGNVGFSVQLLELLKKHANTCPVMLSSSSQASLEGRFAGSAYGKSKLAGEELFFRYSAETGAKALVYRFSNVFGKWCRAGYHSAVATFCDAVANDASYTVNDRSTRLELLYIDDLVSEMLNALEGKEHRCTYEGLKILPDRNGCYCYVPKRYDVTLGEIADLLQSFQSVPCTHIMPEIPADSFAQKLYSTYLSYLPASKISYGFQSGIDARGTFTELIKTAGCGQISVNVAKPGITRGQHWHNSKWEIFIVVYGRALIQERKVGTDESGELYPVHSFEVTGEQLRAVQMLPGYTHCIINLSDTENLVTVMWANEQFDETYPDTFYEKVE